MFFHRSKPKQEASLSPLVENQQSVPPEVDQAFEPPRSPHSRAGADGSELRGPGKSGMRSAYEGSECGFSVATRNTTMPAKNLHYAKFTMAGFQGTKKVLFVPETTQLTPGIMEKALSYLGKEMPSMLIAGVGPRRTATELFCRNLGKSEPFKGLVREAKVSLGLVEEDEDQESQLYDQYVNNVAAMATPLLEFCRPPDEHIKAASTETRVPPKDASVAFEDELPEAVVKNASTVFETNVSSTVHAIGCAAYKTNAWTLTGPRTSELERFLEADAEAPSGMCHLVVGHAQDKAYMESETSKGLMKELFKNAVPLTGVSARKIRPCSLGGEIWNSQRSSTNGKTEKTPWPWPYGEIFLLFYNEEIADNEPTGEANWKYTTPTKFDEKAIPFRADVVAPLARLFIGASGRPTKKHLLQAMKIPTPLLLLDHTSMLIRQASLLCNVLERVYSPAPLAALSDFLSSGALSRLGASPSIPQLMQEIQPWKVLELMEKDFDPTAMEAKERFELPDIVGLFERVQQQPVAYRTVFCVVDPLQRSRSDTALPTVVALFNSRRPGAERSVGLPWQRSRAMVLKAWRLHRKLAQRGVQLRSREIMTVTASGVTMVMSVVCASVMLFMRLQKIKAHQPFGDISISVPFGGSLQLAYDAADFMAFLGLCLPVLTMITGLLSFQSHWQISHKWSRVHVSTTEVESEIYNFLGRVGPYGQNRDTSLRRFRRRLEGRVKQLSLVGVQEDDLGAVDEGFPSSVEALDEHVDAYVYGAGPGSSCLRRLRNILIALNVPGREYVERAPDHDVVDLAAEIDPQRYTLVRLNRLRVYYQTWLRTLVIRRMVLNAALIIVLAGTVIYLFACRFCHMDIVATGRCLCIPVAVSVASLCVTLLNTVASQVLIATLGKALKVLDNADMKLKAAKSLERKSEVMLAFLVAATERIAQAVARAFSEATFAEVDEDDADGSDLEKADKQLSRGDNSVDMEVRSSMSSTLSFR